MPLGEKGYGSLNVRLDEGFVLVDSIKESHTTTLACEVFGVNRSSYKYWAKRSHQLSHEQVELHSKIKSAFEESNQSAGARTIAAIVTARGLKPLQGRSIDEKARTRELSASQPQIQKS